MALLKNISQKIQKLYDLNETSGATWRPPALKHINFLQSQSDRYITPLEDIFIMLRQLSYFNLLLLPIMAAILDFSKIQSMGFYYLPIGYMHAQNERTSSNRIQTMHNIIMKITKLLYFKRLLSSFMAAILDFFENSKYGFLLLTHGLHACLKWKQFITYDLSCTQHNRESNKIIIF